MMKQGARSRSQLIDDGCQLGRGQTDQLKFGISQGIIFIIDLLYIVGYIRFYL